MKHILVNLKRFDIPAELGGVNRLAPVPDWAGAIMDQVGPGISRHRGGDFIFFLPELHLLPALEARQGDQPAIGCQGVSRLDTGRGGGFGALTSQRSARAVAAAGVDAALVGHSEERAAIRDLLERAGVTGDQQSEILEQEIRDRAVSAQAAGLRLTVCIGESLEERDHWRSRLSTQLDTLLPALGDAGLILAYEPLWAIGPGKTPPTPEQVAEIAEFVKSLAPRVPLVYGGGLKAENAAAIAAIGALDGGLIALTRFSGEIGFYPEEYLEILDTYFGALEADK